MINPRSFSWKYDVVILYLSYLDFRMRICLHALLISRIQSTKNRILASSVTPSDIILVLEYTPDIHQLRLSASP